jgi:proline racemase
MLLTSSLQNYFETNSNRLVTVDSHTAGEETRVVLSGIPTIPGETIPEKRLFLKNSWDHYRQILTREPRGSRETIAAVITEPVTPGAAAGMIFMDAYRYPYMCGHGTIGVVTTLIETGLVETCEPVTSLTLDTPSGLIRVAARVKAGKVQSVSIQIVPCFAYKLDQILQVPGFSSLNVDLVYAGGFFTMIDAAQLGYDLIPENAPKIVRLGMDVIAAANAQFTVQHPEQPEVKTIDVAEFYDLSQHAAGRGKGAVVYGDFHVDRSPCGTGTSAKLALMHRRGKLAVGERYTNAGILGTTFEAQIVAETAVGEFPAVVPEITGSAHLTGYHVFVVDPRDPFPQGFLL